MSMSFQTSQSSSVPTVTETPENAMLDQISQYASSLAGQMLNWAQSTFAQTSAITNQAVGNFFNVSQQMSGLSNNLTNQYNNIFAPENAQLVADANSYASPSRMAVDMGQAGATAAQAGQNALSSSEEALKSYGIDPSSGRYAALDKAAAVQNAANVAGAQNTQRNADIATGQRLRSEAVQVGAQLPAAIANVNNTAIQANTGASNASLANANTGANLMKLPNDYLGTAMGLKLPPVGQTSQSSGSGTSSSQPRPPGGGGGGGAPGGGGGGFNNGAGGQAWMPQHTGYQPGNTSMAARGGALPSARIMSFGGSNAQGGPPDAQTMATDPFAQWDTGTGSIGQPTTDPFQDYGGGGDYFGNSYGQDWGNGNTFGDTTANSYTGDTFSGGSSDYGQGSDFTGLGSYNYDPSANQFDGSSFTGQGGAWNDPAPQMSSDPGIWGGSGATQDYSGAASDPFSSAGGSSDPYAGTYDGGGGSSDFSNYGDFAYAAGGAIPPTASPSGGQQVDDIPAQGPGGQPLRMNANEFVIPQDVALWKGQEFFQNLINDSRKKRIGAPAKPKPMMAR